jgi:aspartate oxidase
MEKLVPYCLHLSQDHVKQIKKKAKNRQASKFIRDAITVALESTDEFSSGYNKGLLDACAIINDNKEAKMIAIKSKYLCDILNDQILKLKQEPK